jgi:hypothetical protein
MIQLSFLNDAPSEEYRARLIIPDDYRALYERIWKLEDTQFLDDLFSWQIES